jgi:hypothetical protein
LDHFITGQAGDRITNDVLGDALPGEPDDHGGAAGEISSERETPRGDRRHARTNDDE